MRNLFDRILRFLSIRLRNNLETLPWKLLGLTYELPNGLVLTINNRADWNTYNEIFVRGDYDWAIEKSLQNRTVEKQTFRFLDLGANVGYFTYRVMETIAKRGKLQMPVEGKLIEGSPQVYKQLQKRFKNQSLPNGEIKLVHGLVGKRSGEAKIFESSNYITNSLSSKSSVRRKLGGTLVSYVDVGLLYNPAVKIDLLKCDIEGAELDFLENYRDLLERVNVAVFELHHDKCDTEKCMDLLQRSGLVNQKTIFVYGDSCSLVVFYRET